MKTKLLLSFCCFIAITSFAQDSTFHLKDYKYRTKGYKALELKISFTGQTNNYKQGNSPTEKERLLDLYPSYINYFKIFSSDKRFHSSFISFSPSFRSHVQKNGQDKAKGTNYQTGLTWIVEDRFYKKNNWFLHLANNLYGREDFTKQENTQSNVKTTVPGINESLLLGFGKGRIEMVQDAQMALFILNDLKDQGLIAALPTADLTNEFAQLITQINNSRVLDSRKRRIYELTLIDKFLREKEIVSITDIRHFTAINDNWTLAFNPYREAGSSWSVNVRSSAEIGKSKQTTTSPNLKTVNENKNKLFGIGPSVDYENHKPISLKWQRDIEASLSWQVARSEQGNKYLSGNTSLNSELKTTQYRGVGYASYAIGFYPNNRTLLNTTLGIDVLNLKYKSGLSGNQTSIRPWLNFSTDYFVSFKTRLTANVYSSYSYEHTNSSSIPLNTINTFHTGFSVGISHYFL